MRTKAAVLWKPGTPVEILDVELAPPREREVLVRIAACGVCASDLHVVDGDLPEPLPLVLGHEASGVVVETGPGVDSLRSGDHVVLALVPSCGDCAPCRAGRPTFCDLFGRCASEGVLADGTSRLSVEGTTLHHFNSVSSFAEHAVVPASAAVPVRRDVPLDAAALVGCALITGFGAVVNTAGVEAGAAVAVWGCGGVGLSVVQAARLAGAERIVAVDTRPDKLDLAGRLGATDLVAPDAAGTAAAVRELVPGGVDYAFEAIGREATINEAWEAVRSGGTVVVVGLMPKGSKLTIDPWGFINEKSLRGCFLGTARIERDIPRIVDLVHEGELELEALVSRRIRLDELPEALDRLRAGDAVRQLVVFD
ncbi:MAG TPA: Zn-dependent alcohol dehydrogenase [Gaiellaceae bacterium]|nr:Zn-dependent alcohol dehydrogenase [Gaiellaceae bacterium]